MHESISFLCTSHSLHRSATRENTLEYGSSRHFTDCLTSWPSTAVLQVVPSHSHNIYSESVVLETGIECSLKWHLQKCLKKKKKTSDSTEPIFIKIQTVKEAPFCIER